MKKILNPLFLCVLAFAQWAFADFTHGDSAKALASCPSGSSFIGVTVYGESVDEARSKARTEIANSIISIVRSRTSMSNSSDESNGILDESGSFLSVSEIESNATIKGFREIETPKLKNGEYELKGYICRSYKGVYVESSDAFLKHRISSYLANHGCVLADEPESSALNLKLQASEERKEDDIMNVAYCTPSVHVSLGDSKTGKGIFEDEIKLPKEGHVDMGKACEQALDKGVPKIWGVLQGRIQKGSCKPASPSSAPPPAPEPPPAKAPPSAGGKPNVAVGAIGDEPEDFKALNGLSTKLTEAIVKNGRYTAIDRSEEILKQLGKEHSYQNSGAVDNKEQIKQLGTQLSVQYLCIVKSSELKAGEYQLSARLVDVETAEIKSMGSELSSLRDTKELMDVAEVLATKLLGKPKAPPKPLGKSFWVGGALDVIGAALLTFGVVKYFEGERRYSNYKSMKSGDFDAVWKNTEKSQNAANILFWSGGAALALGIGVHVIF